MEILFAILIVAIFLLAISAAFLRRARRSVFVLLILCLALVAAMAAGVPQFSRRLRTAYSQNIAETSPQPEFPELHTRFYSAPPAKVLEQATAVIEQLPRWKLVAADAAQGSLKAEKKVLGFTDDVVVQIRAEDSRTRVDARSRSRVGKGDFGENRRHIAQFLEALDARLR
jgi:uncharacterized protein (DUF1499 family)